MHFSLKIWRQAAPRAKGYFEHYAIDQVDGDTSFLEMLDMLNNKLVKENKETIAFDHDCREGICGACGLYINGRPHGPDDGITTCQLYMRRFRDGSEITVEPFRSKAFPVIKDLMVSWNAFDENITGRGICEREYRKCTTSAYNTCFKGKPRRAWTPLRALRGSVASCKNGSAMLLWLPR